MCGWCYGSARPRPLTAKGGTTTFGVMKGLMAYGGRVLAGGALMVNVALVVDDYIKASPWEGPELIPAVTTATSSGPTFTMAGVGDLPNPAVYLIAERMKTRAIAASYVMRGEFLFTTMFEGQR